MVAVGEANSTDAKFSGNIHISSDTTALWELAGDSAYMTWVLIKVICIVCWVLMDLEASLNK